MQILFSLSTNNQTYQRGPYDPSSPVTNDLHAVSLAGFVPEMYTKMTYFHHGGEPSFNTVRLSLSSTKIQAHASRSSLAASHPSTVLAVCYFTSVFKWKLMDPAQAAACCLSQHMMLGCKGSLSRLQTSVEPIFLSLYFFQQPTCVRELRVKVPAHYRTVVVCQSCVPLQHTSQNFWSPQLTKVVG